MLKQVIKNPSKKPLILILLGITFASMGLILAYKPEVVEKYKSKIKNNIQELKSKFSK